MNFTFQQKLTMSMGIVGAATTAFGALNSIMTPTEALIGTVVFGFTSACLGVVATVTSSQTAQVKSVAAMPGIDSIKVNAGANKDLAQAAISADPTLAKVEPTVGAEAAITRTAAS